MAEYGARATRSGQPSAPRVLEFRDLRIEIDAHRVICGHREVQLTRSEFDLLVLLASNPGVVLSREELFKSLWDAHWVGDGHAIEVQVSRLRQKLGDHDKPFISTIRSAGYRFDGEPIGHAVSVTYDARLRVTSVDPGDRPFFGWDPQEVIGTFFLLDASAARMISQEDAIRMITVMAETGVLVTESAYEILYADGSKQTHRGRIELLLDEHGVFCGARVSVS